MQGECNEEGIALDGYGDDFPPEAQIRHLGYILAHLSDVSEAKEAVVIKQEEWKDKPAGHYSKGSGV